MANGRFALAAAQREEKEIKSRHRSKKSHKESIITPRVEMIQNATVRFFTIFFAIFVGFLEFFSCGFESGLRKALTMCEGGEKIKP